MLSLYFFYNRLETAIPLLLAKLRTFLDKDTVSIAFPDEGAFKRFHTQFEGYPTIICIKQREDNERIVKIKDGWLSIYIYLLQAIHVNV